MSFTAKETGVTTGQPIELLHFAQDDGSGTSTDTYYTSGDTKYSVDTDGGGPYDFIPRPLMLTAVDHSQEDAGSSVEVLLPIDDAIASQFGQASSPQPLWLTVYLKHRTDTEVVVAFIGKCSGSEFAGNMAKLTFSPIMVAFQRTIPPYKWQRQCNWNLYGTGCGATKSLLPTTLTSTSDGGLCLQSTDFESGFTSGALIGGFCKFSGVGRAVLITQHPALASAGFTPPGTHQARWIRVQTVIPGVTTGSTVQVVMGCDRTESVCNSRFGNLGRHFGFSRIPPRNPIGGL